MMKLRLLFVLAVMAPLASCTDWLGGSEKEIPLPGKRISLKTQQSGLAADVGVKDEPIVLLAMPANAAWPQVQGNATGVSGNLAFGKAPQLQNSVSVGEGTPFTSPLIPPPIVADGMVFAMDGSGALSAHHADDIDKLYWHSSALMHGEDDESPLLGGGLAWSKGTLFAANDEGKVAAFNASNGSRRWVKELKLPLRSPPRVAGNLLLLLTADNQLLALLQSTGDLSWSHRGISEVAGKLQASSPAIRDNTVLVTYSSGEVSALDLPSGNPLWSDNLAGAGPDSADPATSAGDCRAGRYGTHDSQMHRHVPTHAGTAVAERGEGGEGSRGARARGASW
jgi:outer membrane protein assembly factor BamB